MSLLLLLHYHHYYHYYHYFFFFTSTTTTTTTTTILTTTTTCYLLLAGRQHLISDWNCRSDYWSYYCCISGKLHVQSILQRLRTRRCNDRLGHLGTEADLTYRKTESHSESQSKKLRASQVALEVLTTSRRDHTCRFYRSTRT